MATINIGGQQSDSSFRYKMPVMQLKTEGRGNGIKTIILNIKDISKALNVEPAYPIKFFGIELGTQTKFDDSRAIINGSHSLTHLSQLLDHFIKQFILCSRCNLPELIWKVGKSVIKTNCSACGNSSIFKETHKLINFILKNPPKSKQSRSSIPQTNSSKDIMVHSEVHSSDNEDWSEETDSKESSELSDLQPQSSSVSLKSLIKEHQPYSRILSELRLLELSRGLNQQQKYKILLEAMFDITQPKLLVSSIDTKLLHQAAKDELSKMSLFSALEEVIGESEQCILRISMIFHKLYEDDLYDEEFFICWYDSPPEASITVSRPIGVMLRKNSEPFIKWLKTSDE
jgi:translation initiation factor 5